MGFQEPEDFLIIERSVMDEYCTEETISEDKGMIME